MIIKLILLALLIFSSLFILYFFYKLSKYEAAIKDFDANGSYSYDDAYGYKEDSK